MLRLRNRQSERIPNVARHILETIAFSSSSNTCGFFAETGPAMTHRRDIILHAVPTSSFFKLHAK